MSEHSVVSLGIFWVRCFVQLGGQRHIRVIMSLGWLGNVLVSGRARGGGWGKRLTT